MADGDGGDEFDGRDRREPSETETDGRRPPEEQRPDEETPPPTDETGTGDETPTSDRSQQDRETEWSPSRVARDPEKSSQSRETDDAGVTIEDDGYLRWFLRTDDGTVTIFRDVLTSVAIVAVIGLVLFAFSGIWPPLVAVESGSMEPNIHEGDLVFIVEGDRFVGDDPVEETGIVPAENGVESGHEKFDQPGDVVVFLPNGGDGTPVIHRAHYWVEEGDNWVEETADPEYVDDVTCDDIQTCPANHDGFITKGDNNPSYDQMPGVGTETDVVRPEWVTGKASVRIPWLGNVRLFFDDYLLGNTLVGPNGNSVLEDGQLSATAVAAITTGSGGAATFAAVAGRRRYRQE